MAAIEGTDIAILSSRLGVARLGASRLGFYPDDVEGTGTSEPGEYVWKETFPPETQWTLQTEGPTCGKRPLAGFTMVGETQTPTMTVTWVVAESESNLPGESFDYTFTPTVVGGTAPYTYAWDFDGPTSAEEVPVHYWDRGTYSNPDTIPCSLIVTDSNLDVAAFSDNVTVIFNE